MGEKKRRKVADLLVLPRPAESLDNGAAQASAEKLEHTGPAEKDMMASVTQNQ